LADTDWLTLYGVLIKADAVRLACLAGAAPKDLLETYNNAGIDEYISVKANCYETLERLQKKKGMIA